MFIINKLINTRVNESVRTKREKFHKSSFPWCHDRRRPWPLTRDEFYMNPSSTADQATAKLIAVKRTLPLDRLVKRNSKPIPPLLPHSFCPPSMRFDFISASLSSKSPSDEEPLRHPRGGPKPGRHEGSK